MQMWHFLDRYKFMCAAHPFGIEDSDMRRPRLVYRPIQGLFDRIITIDMRILTYLYKNILSIYWESL